MYIFNSLEILNMEIRNERMEPINYISIGFFLWHLAF